MQRQVYVDIIIMLCILLAQSATPPRAYAQSPIDLGPPVTITRIFEYPERSVEDLYGLAQKWISYTYTNPEHVRLARIPGEFIRGRGFAENIILFDETSNVYGDATYQFEIEIRHGKARWRIYDIHIRRGGKEYRTAADWLYRSSGKLKENSIFTDRIITGLTNHFTALAADLDRYLTDPKNYRTW